MNSFKEAVLEYLLHHPGSHYGLDMVNAGDAAGRMIYVHLGSLEEKGYLEGRHSPEPPRPGCLPVPNTVRQANSSPRELVALTRSRLRSPPPTMNGACCGPQPI